MTDARLRTGDDGEQLLCPWCGGEEIHVQASTPDGSWQGGDYGYGGESMITLLVFCTTCPGGTIAFWHEAGRTRVAYESGAGDD